MTMVTSVAWCGVRLLRTATAPSYQHASGVTSGSRDALLYNADAREYILTIHCSPQLHLDMEIRQGDPIV